MLCDAERAILSGKGPGGPVARRGVPLRTSGPQDRWPSFEELLRAYHACRLKKSANVSQSRFERHLGQSLLQLQKEIQTSTYRPAPMKCFVVDEPKPREIFAAEFRDRVVHHLVITLMEPIWERKFVHSSFACRRRKGVHGALRHLQAQVRRISRGGRSAVWVLQLDLARFFVSIHRPTLCTLMEKHAPFPEVRALIRVIYLNDGRVGAKIQNPIIHRQLIPHAKSWFSQGPDCGLPIGNLTSQFGANVYLNSLDHFIQRQLKPTAYLRYMDDLLLIDRDIDRLRTWGEPIDLWLHEHRHQSLNPTKTKLVNLEEGITYLGCHAAQTGKRSEPLQFFPTGKKKWKFIQGLRQLAKLNDEPLSHRPHPLALWLPNPVRQRELASINSRFGSLVHSESYGFRKKALERFEKDLLGPALPPEIDPGSWSPYKIKEGYRAIRHR